MEFQGSGGATALVGIAGFVVGVQAEVDGEWWLSVETSASTAGCSSCGSRAIGHGRRQVKVRHLAICGRPTVLYWSKRIWRCPDPDCEVMTWTETSEEIEPGGLLTVRAGREICRAVGADGVAVAAVARRFGVGWAAAMTAVRRHGTPLVDDPGRAAATRAVGVDETTFLHAGPGRRTSYVTGIIDLDRGRLLDVVAGRSGKVVAGWLASRPEARRAQITVAATDAFRG